MAPARAAKVNALLAPRLGRGGGLQGRLTQPGGSKSVSTPTSRCGRKLHEGMVLESGAMGGSGLCAARCTEADMLVQVAARDTSTRQELPWRCRRQLTR